MLLHTKPRSSWLRRRVRPLWVQHLRVPSKLSVFAPSPNPTSLKIPSKRLDACGAKKVREVCLTLSQFSWLRTFRKCCCPRPSQYCETSLSAFRYASAKFLVFDLSTERLLEAFPAANEDLKLSLLVTLVGGILGGTAAAIVSNPADTVISEMKKDKAKITPQEAFAKLIDRSGVNALFTGLQLRIIFYSLIASLQFVVFDGVRFALGIGPDDLKLYLDVLGGALNQSGGIS